MLTDEELAAIEARIRGKGCPICGGVITLDETDALVARIRHQMASVDLAPVVSDPEHCFAPECLGDPHSWIEGGHPYNPLIEVCCYCGGRKP